MKNEDLEKSGVYKITNKINGKFYIGSALNFKKRWEKHISALNLLCHDNPKLQNAWNKYGNENFTFEIIEYVEDILLIEREQWYFDNWMFAQEYIRKEDKRFVELHYNICPTAGSNFGRQCTDESRKKMSVSNSYRKIAILQFDKEGNFIREWESIYKTEEILKIRGITKVCEGKSSHAGGFIWKYRDKKSPQFVSKTENHEILQYDLDNNFIKEWFSIDAIKKEYGNSIHVKDVCVGNRNSANGFIWKYKYPEKIKNKEKNKKIETKKQYYKAKIVLRFDLDNNFIDEWKSVKSVAEHFGFIATNISSACRKNGGYSNGFKWKYKE